VPSAVAPVSPQVDPVILRALAKHREDRFPGPLAFVRALRAALEPARTERIMAGAISVAIEAPGEALAGAEVRDQVEAVLDQAVEMLAARGLAPAFETDTHVVCAAAEPCPDLPALAREVVLHLRPRLDRQLGLTVCAHRAEAQVQGGAIRGGPVLALESWVPRGRCGAHATGAAFAGPPQRARQVGPDLYELL
jgi:eukaryotic-like serine/threonine-protein kinase